jgi:hypothetical protein
MLATKCEAGAGDVLKSCITLRKQTAKRRMQKGGSRVPRTGCISRLAFDLLQIAWSGSHAPLRKLHTGSSVHSLNDSIAPQIDAEVKKIQSFALGAFSVKKSGAGYHAPVCLLD